MNDRGFTLVETIVAALLISATVATVSALLTMTFRYTEWNVNRDHAVTLARHEVEDLRALPYDDLASRQTVSAWRGLTFTVDTTVTDDDPDPNMKGIAIDVSWNERGLPATYGVRTTFIDVR